MNAKRGLLAALVLLLIACGAVGYCYKAERTPEYALRAVAEGINERDSNKIGQYVDLDNLIRAAYDESTAILCRDIARLNKTYPQDWFFYHDTAFMQDYIAKRRCDDLVFIQRAVELYLDPDIVPVSSSDGQAKWVSDEVNKFLQEYTARLKSVEKNGGRAIAAVQIEGKQSPYGRLVPELELKLELVEQPDGHWRITRVSNVSEAFDPVVKGIEDYWDLKGWPVRTDVPRNK